MWQWTASQYDKLHAEVRGGSWNHRAQSHRASNKGAADPAEASNRVGFRCAR